MKIRIFKCLNRLFIIWYVWWLHDLVKKCLYLVDAFIFSCPTHTKNLRWFLIKKFFQSKLFVSKNKGFFFILFFHSRIFRAQNMRKIFPPIPSKKIYKLRQLSCGKCVYFSIFEWWNSQLCQKNIIVKVFYTYFGPKRPFFAKNFFNFNFWNTLFSKVMPNFWFWKHDNQYYNNSHCSKSNGQKTWKM